MFVCGWDGGGTKTQVLCLDAHGERLAEGVFGPLNLNGADSARVVETVRAGVAFMADQPGGLSACAQLVIGTAGVSNEEAVCLLTEAVRAAGYSGGLMLLGDQEIALAGAIEGPGAVLVAGTGSICCGRDETGRTVRVGGYGYLIDDEGSGYALGRDILTAVVRAEDGRCGSTVLTEKVRRVLGTADVRSMVTWLYAPKTGKKEIAALAPLLLEAIAEGDEASVRIADKAARELAALAVAAWRELGLEKGELALAGSILMRYPCIREGVKRRCQEACPQMTVIAPRGSAVQGAARLAYEHMKEGTVCHG